MQSSDLECSPSGPSLRCSTVEERFQYKIPSAEHEHHMALRMDHTPRVRFPILKVETCLLRDDGRCGNYNRSRESKVEIATHWLCYICAASASVEGSSLIAHAQHSLVCLLSSRVFIERILTCSNMHAFQSNSASPVHRRADGRQHMYMYIVYIYTCM